jgi:chloramphenicol-sensitive protein RarD
MQTSRNPDLGRGFLFGFSAYLIWGSFPLVIAMLSFASPFEVVAWRVLFGFALSVLLIAATNGWASVRQVLREPKNLLWLVAAALLIYVNWQAYVIGILAGHVVETSLGYFINPLVTIVLAVFFLGEKLRPLQWVAVGLGLLAVSVLTFDYGRLPWIALLLAASFGLYGLVKNKLGGKVSALNSFTFESGFLIPVAVVQLLLVSLSGIEIQFGRSGMWPSLGLILFGIMTAIPLILFGAAAKRLPLSFIGFMQYLTPVIQFILGLTVFQEHMPPVRWVGFIAVWVGLAVLTFDAMRSRSKSA